MDGPQRRNDGAGWGPSRITRQRPARAKGFLSAAGLCLSAVKRSKSSNPREPSVPGLLVWDWIALDHLSLFHGTPFQSWGWFSLQVLRTSGGQ